MLTDDQSVQVQRMTGEWQRFLDIAIHDLRGPLRGIGTSAELLTEVCDNCLNEEARQHLRTILDGVAKIEGLSKALSLYARALQADCPPSGPIRVESALRSALVELASQIRLTGATVNYDPLPRLHASHEQLSILFRALIDNALLYRGADPPSIHIRAHREGHQWHFAVRDNGLGIEPKYWNQIFQPFQRLHAHGPAGVGLGLSICQKIVEAHGGTIWVESQLRAGSTFFFTIPADSADIESVSGGGS